MLMPEVRPYVRFYTEERENRAATLENGIYTPMDVHMVEVTPVGGKNVFLDEAENWLRKIRERSLRGQYSRDWVRDFDEMFKMYKEGEEIPEKGISIKTCIMFSPAQQKQILNANIRTLEDLASCTEEGLQAMGPGGRELRDRARAAIDQAKDSGKVAAEVAALKVENAEQRQQISDLLDALKNAGIDTTPRRGPGRPPKVAESK